VGDVVERLKDVRHSTVAARDAAVLALAVRTMVEPPRRSNGSIKVPEFSAVHIAARLKKIYLRLAVE
jgi:hypothetical protein